MTLDAFFEIASTAGWVGALALLITYHRSARWWKTGYGRALMVLILVILSFFATSMLFNLFGDDYPGRLAMRIINMVLTVSMTWYLLLTMIVDGTRARKERHLIGITDEVEK